MPLFLSPSRRAPLTALFVPSEMPGPIFRELENRAFTTFSPFTSLRPDTSSRPTSTRLDMFLNGPPNYKGSSFPWRVLFADANSKNEDAVAAANDFLFRLGPHLSQKFKETVYGLEVPPRGSWRFTQWDAGTVTKIGGTAAGSAERPIATGLLPFLRRGSRGHFPPSLQAWTRENHLPLADVPVRVNWKRRANIFDYESVAGLERKGLLLETNRVWYRVSVDVPLGEPDGGIIDAP